MRTLKPSLIQPYEFGENPKRKERKRESCGRSSLPFFPAALQAAPLNSTRFPGGLSSVSRLPNHRRRKPTHSIEFLTLLRLKDSKPVDKGSVSCSQRLGVLGLSLHYANIINQIDSIVSRPSSIPPNTRDTLYHGLPSSVKAALRLRLQLHHVKEELAVPQIKAEMEKSLQWIVPIATNTTKAHQGFGWVGEWANTGNEFNKKTASQNNLIRLQTFYHADKEKMDEYILELVTWLHRLVSQVKYKDHSFKFQAPVRSPTQKGISLSPGVQNNPSLVCNSRTDTAIQLSEEDKEMLKEVSNRKLVPGISKSQEFDTGKKRKGYKEWRLSRSIGNSPVKEFTLALDLECERIRVLDVMDGLDSVAVS